MRVIITGGLGFIGFNLAKSLSKKGFHVIIIDSLVSGSNNQKWIEKDWEIHKLGLDQTEQIIKILKKAEIVIHLAALGNVIQSVKNPIVNFKNNVFSTIKLLEAMRIADCQKIIFSSTGGALMGNTNPPVSELSIPKPISPYGASKLACEGYLSAYSNSYDISSIIFRFGNVYGPFSSHKIGVINKFIRNAIESKKSDIYGSIETTRDYIHVNDIVKGLTLGIKYFENINKKSEIFHLANGEGITLKKIINEINSCSERPMQIDYKPYRKGEVKNNHSSFKYAEEVLGFSPDIKLNKGIKELYEWIIRNEY